MAATSALGFEHNPDMQPGDVIADKFRLVRELGRGGMGAVWEAVHETLGRTVAVKFLTPQQKDPTLAERFVSEARMVASIKHRFVIDVFDFGVTTDGLYYMVLELLEGEELSEHMDGGPAFSAREGVRLIADCMKGLDAVHAAGIVHRDLKPENVFIVHDGDGAFPKLIDFGISRRAQTTEGAAPAKKIEGRGSRLTEPGMLVGTPWYMSPEQLRGRADIDRRADVYSVGVILYELLAGRLPYAQENVADLMVAIVTKSAPALIELRRDLGVGISDVVARAMAVEPEQRYPNALALRDALMAVIPSLPADAKTALQKDVPARPYGQYTEIQLKSATDPFADQAALAAKKRRMGLMAAIVACVVVLGGLAAWLGSGSHSDAAKTAALPAPLAGAATPSVAVALPAVAPPAAAAPALAPPPPPSAATTVAPSAVVSAAPTPAPSTPRAAVAASPVVKHSASAAGSHSPASAPAHSARPSAAPSKKLFHQLDF